MGNKRKRPGQGQGKDRGPTASSQTSITASRGRLRCAARNDQTTHPVISLYYPEVLTLRQYLLRQLPISSKLRRRRIASLRPLPTASPNAGRSLSELLDSTLVGLLKKSSPNVDSDRQRDYRAFTQSQSRSILVSTDTGPTSPQSEVVDFVIEQLFKHNTSYQRPEHLLTHGFQRPARGQNALETNIPGVVIQFPNRNVQTLKDSPWSDILGLLGQNGDEIMMRLLFDCGIFAPIDSRMGVFYQLSGYPLSMLQQINEQISETGSGPDLPASGKPSKGRRNRNDQGGQVRGLNSIVFLRRRMLYSRSGDGCKGARTFGLGSSHVFNRFASLDSIVHTKHVMKYIFPRQFGLRNVFVSTGDGPEDGDLFKTHGFREEEIHRLEAQKRHLRDPPRGTESAEDHNGDGGLKVPKRLRGQAMELVRRMRVCHARCSYTNLLQHYCPAGSNGPWKLATAISPAKRRGWNSELESSLDDPLITQLQVKSPVLSKPCNDTPISQPTESRAIPEEDERERKIRVPKPKLSLTDYATPVSSVSAFCRSVLQKLIPLQFFGEGSEGKLNRNLVMQHVDSFIKLRRFENLSLHEVCKGLKVANIPWLITPRLGQSSEGKRNKIALSDFQKRAEILHEFIYYIFDSLLIPLVRANFYVTESQTHRNRLFYFRHDVWRQLTEKPFENLKESMFEEVEPARAERLLARRSLGVGSLRLLPKSTGLRPILNLRKRVLKEANWGGKKRPYLASSVNSSITPLYSVLSYERNRAPVKLGSSMYSMGDMHPRLKEFKNRLIQQLPPVPGVGYRQLPPLFFVKLDIQACFDTIPQKELLRLVEELVSEETYHITKHVEMNPSVAGARGRPTRKYVSRAAPARKQQQLPDLVASGVQARKANTVFIDTIKERAQGVDELLDLLDEHVRKNLVKMGTRYFRQRNGIPQGSILSSLLCNFFYAELEHEVLGFLQPADSLLLRMIDDFLLVTTDRQQATQFLQVMIRGQPSYGVTVNPAKSMVNFTAAVDGIHIPRLEGSSLFPYCGSLVDTHTLEIHRDQDRALEGGDSAAAILSNTLTVETSRLPGHAFRRKVLASFRLQILPMYLDTAHNSRSVVLGNLYTSFITSAMKMFRYMKSLRGRAHPSTSMIVDTIQGLIQQTSGMIQVRRVSSTAPLSCLVQLSHLQYLAAAAFRFVLKRKQTRYAPVLHWLDSLGKESRPATNSEALRLTQVVKRGTELFDGWRF
ncbi:Telomere reverse transcriptase [Penicillium hispanicum]|uniref:Telomere reverse transcriptase n=1 Tax=Penicillium hispanicum TaxID=1080232 RepID=UPI0025409D22|nr:Telomere reverse transcriptase [Penicillium hispanicum]KAJ5577953.1 Telomere reverse transcriptase [Penicillium hispanicum]